jgi:hypothetical protein
MIRIDKGIQQPALCSLSFQHLIQEGIKCLLVRICASVCIFGGQYLSIGLTMLTEWQLFVWECYGRT